MNADRINEHYYGDPVDPATERARARVHWICAQATGDRILDIGCSQGIVSLILGREGFHCTGLDLEAASLAVAREALLKEDELVRGRVTFQAGDAANLPFDSESFDTVILGEVLEHLIHPVKVLGEALRVLRDGGRLIVTVPYGLNAFHDHKHTYYPLSLLELLLPRLRTEIIDTLKTFIVYRGVKDASYSPSAHGAEDLQRCVLGLHRQVEERCLEKELALLKAVTKHRKQSETLGAQAEKQQAVMDELRAALRAREAEVGTQQTRIRDLESAAAKAEAELKAVTLDLETVRRKQAQMESRAAELEAEATAASRRLAELVAQIDQSKAETAALQHLLATREADQSKRSEEHLTDAVRQAAVLRELQQTASQQDLRIQDLQRALHESRSMSDEVRRSHEDHVRALNERIREQRADLDGWDQRAQSHREQVLALERSRQDALQQAEQLRRELGAASEELTRLRQEVRLRSQSAEEQQVRSDSLERQVTTLTTELRAFEEESRRRAATAETQRARDLRAKDSEIKDLKALLDARTREQQLALEVAAKECDLQWERKLLNQRVRELVRQHTPPGAQVLVVSKGDDQLLQLDGRQGGHFPQAETGVYAGYHPGSSEEAIAHLEQLRAAGAQYILFPRPSFWWLEFYRELREHLDHTARLVAFDDPTGALYDLAPTPTGFPVRFTVATRKNGDPQKTERPRAAKPPAAQLPAAAVPASTPPSPPPRPPELGVILDEFTMGCLAPECGLLTFRPDNWREKLEQHHPKALFVESAWRGNEGAWLYRVAQYPRNMGNELAELLQWAQQHNVPSIFWNKEDPVHFERFIDRAKLFSHVFTTDADCLPKYREQIGHDRAFALPFAAQPALHNPVHDSPRAGAVCFAGTYYGNRHEQRQVDMDYVLRPAISFGLDIYDRQYGLAGKEADAYRFPQDYQPCIRGRLDYDEMVKAYRHYRVFLNVNSVKQSPTMFSRRVFELLACGTPVVSTYSRGIVDLLGEDVVFITESEEDTRRHLERLLGDETAWARASTRGIRKVMQAHTYAHRLAEVFEHTGLQPIRPTPPRISLVVPLGPGDALERLAPALAAQTFQPLEVLLLSSSPLSAQVMQTLGNRLPHVRLIACVGSPEAQWSSCLQSSAAEYLAFLNPSDSYGPNYLMDYALAIGYSGAPFLGKHSYFAAGEGASLLRQPGGEYRWVTEVPASSLLARKTVLRRSEFLKALEMTSFQRQTGPILSIDRFNYLQHASSRLTPTQPGSDMPRQLREISA